MNKITDQAAVFLLPTTDRNNALSQTNLNHLFETIQKTHTVVCRRMETADIAGTLKEIKAEIKKKITALFICGHGSRTELSFKDLTGIYRLEDIRSEHFKELDPDGCIYLHSCSTINLAKRIACLTNHIVYAPTEICYADHSVLLPGPNKNFELVHYNLDIQIITKKHHKTTTPDGISSLWVTDIAPETCLQPLTKESEENNPVALFLLGLHVLNGIETPQDIEMGFRYIYLAATKGNKTALRWLEEEHLSSEGSYYLALFYLNERKGYEYLLNATLNFYPPAMNLLSKKAQENDPLAFLYLGKNCEAQENPLFLDYYLKAALLGQNEGYHALLKAATPSSPPLIRGKAALYAGIFLQPSNPMLAVHYFKKAVEMNVNGAKEKLKDLETPAKLQLEELEKRAQQGDAEALYELGKQAMVECRPQEALALFKEAAEKGSAKGLRAFQQYSTRLANAIPQFKQS